MILTYNQNYNIQYDDNYFIKSSEFEVSDYEIIFKPNEYHWNIISRFHIRGNFKLPSQSLYFNLIFPSQKVEKNWLNLKSYNQTSSNKYNYVFEGNTILPLSSSDYWKRNFNNENVHVNIDFKLSKTNISNYATQANKKVAEDFVYSSFVNKVEQANTSFNFRYTNSYKIENFKNNNNYIFYSKELSVLTDWKVYKNQNNKYNYEKINFNLPNYWEIQNKPIRKFYNINFADFLNQQVFIKNIRSEIEYSFNNEEIKKLELANDLFNFFRKTNNYDWIFDKYTTFATSERALKIFFNKEIKGIFIPLKSEGIINTDLILKIKNHGVKVNLKNKFSFKKDLIFNPENTKQKVFINSRKLYNVNLNEFNSHEF